ncbi:unnamed protein product [Coregonus sp. 'balchen']|nr:unnamed protein product [Coregonus sp. 'balchen']
MVTTETRAHCRWLTASQAFITRMAAQVEVQTGEVGRTGVGGRLHLSPLADSSNKSLTEGPSNTQGSLIITPEPSKPVPAPKPRLTPKPFAVEKTPTIRPILAPKPNTKPRPEPTRLTSYKPDPPSGPKPQQPNVTSKHRPVSTNHSRPAPTSYKPSPKLSMGQTTRSVAQPFKPTPLTPGDPSKPTPSQPVGRQKPAAAGLSHSQGPKKPPSAEWSGSTKQEKECGKTASSIRAGGASLTRAKSMGFLRQIGLEGEERKGDEGPEVTVQLRPQSTGSRPRPVSAIFLPSPTQLESSTPADRWVGRRPLSADLTSKFESIGLSLHRGHPAKTGSKENTPEEGALLRRREKEAEGTAATPPAPDSKPSALARGSEKKKEEVKDEGKGGGSIKRRISLLLDSSSPVVPLCVAAQGLEPHSPVQPVPEVDVPLGGVKQRIKKLTIDTVMPPAQTPAVKPPFKPRPLPPDLTKRFGSEKSTDLGSPSPSEATDRHESDTDPQRRGQDSVFIFSDQRKVDEDTRGSKEQPTQASSGPSAGRTAAWRGMEIEAQESHPSSGVQTVRAALFENVVERHSVMEEDRAQSITKNCPKRSVSLKLGDGENGGSLVTSPYREPVSPYREPVSPSSPLRVEHLFDTVQAVGERRAVSESLPSAQLEDKAMTLRSRRSEGNRPARAEPVEEISAQVQGDLSSAQRGAPASQHEQGPCYLRVGALQKWNTTEVDRGAEVEKGREMEKERQMERERREEEKERQREAERRMQIDVEREKPREQDREREEVAAPKRLKMLEADEQPPKPRATYFALTGQIQEVISHGDEGTGRGDMEVPFDDFSVMSGQWGSQGKVQRNPSLGKAFGKIPQGQEQEEELMERKQTQERGRGMAWDRQTGMEEMEIEKQKQVDLEKVRELEREKEQQRERKEFEREMEMERERKEVEREKQRQLEMERQKQLEYARKRKMEKQRELERERQNELEKERRRDLERERRRDLERERQRELERERQRELERERQRELERERQRELERERQRELERERQRELERERQRELERERQRELERERQRELERERQRELERQKEFEKERQKQLDLERQNKLERQRVEELERIKEMERRQLFRFEKQKQAERERQQLLELEKQRLREKMEKEEQEKMRQQAIQQEVDRQRELERERQKELGRKGERDLEIQRQRELERQRQKQFDIKRQELENQRERQRVEALERITDLERRQLIEKQKQNERERQHLHELEKQRLREKMEKEEQEKMRPVARQQEERQRRENQERGVLDSLPLRPKVLDLDSVSLGDQHSRGSSHSPGVRWKQPSPRAEDHYRPGILDIDSFRSQTQMQPSPTREVFPIAGIKGSDPGSGVRSHTPEREGSRRVGAVGRPSPVWAPSQQELWEQRLGIDEESVDRPMAGPEPPRKPANKPSLEQLLHRQLDRVTAPILVPERRWSGMPSEPSFPRREPHSLGSPMEQTWFPQDSEPQGHMVEARGQRRSQGSQELNRMRSRSVSRRSAPSESAVEGTLSRMRSRSAHRERGRQSWDDDSSVDTMER